MPFPIRPRPIMPSCIRCSCRAASDVLQVESGDPPAAFLQRRIVTRRLRADQAAEAERLPRDRQFLPGVVDHLQEEAAVRSALVQLPGRVEVAGPVPARYDEAAVTSQLADEIRDTAVVFGGRLDERLNTDVVALLRLCEQPLDRALGLDVGLLAGCEHLARLVLRGLHIGPVEGVDAEEVSRNGDRELPAEELAGEGVRVGDLGLGGLPVGPVGRFTGSRDEALALLARRLRDELLGPQAEAALRLRDADLVAARLPAGPECAAELVPWVAVLLPAELGHAVCVREETCEVDPHERGGNHAERRKRRVATADRRLSSEDATEASLIRQRLETRAWIGDRDELRPLMARALPEVIGVRARLERATRLRRRDEQGAAEVDSALDCANRGRMRGVEDVEALDAERPPQHLRREARAAHTEEDDGIAPFGGTPLGEGFEGLPLLSDAARLVEPAEPLRLVGSRPYGRIALPDSPDQLGALGTHAAASSPRFARTPSRSSANASANFWTPSSSSVWVTSS